FAQPEVSWRRKRSEKTTINSQIQMIQRKKMNIVQITCQNVSASNKSILLPIYQVRAEILKAQRDTRSGCNRATASGSHRQSAQLLVRLHVEPHREERELDAEDQQQRDQHGGRGRDHVAEDAQDDLGDPESEAGEEQRQTQDVEEDERVEVPDHVLLLHPP